MSERSEAASTHIELVHDRFLAGATGRPQMWVEWMPAHGTRLPCGGDARRPAPQVCHTPGPARKCASARFSRAGPGASARVRSTACSWRHRATAAVVTGGEDLGDGHALPHGRAGVDRPLEQVLHAARGEGVVGVARLVAQHAGDQPADGLDHHEHGRLGTGEDVVADRDLVDDHAAARPAVRVRAHGTTRESIPS